MILSQQIERAGISAANASLTAAKETINATKSLSRASISVASGTISATSNATKTLSRASVNAATGTIKKTKKLSRSISMTAANETINATRTIGRAGKTAANETLNVTMSLFNTVGGAVGDSLDPVRGMVARSASSSLKRNLSITKHAAAADTTNIFCSELVGRDKILSQFEDVTKKVKEVTELEIEDFLCTTCHHDLSPVVGSLVFKNDRPWTLIRFLDSFGLDDFIIWHTKLDSMMQDYGRCWVHMPSPYAKDAMIFKAVITIDEGTPSSDLFQVLKTIKDDQYLASFSLHGLLGANLSPLSLGNMVSWDDFVLNDSFTMEVEYSWSTQTAMDTAKQFLKRCMNRLPTSFDEGLQQDQDDLTIAKKPKTRRKSPGSLMEAAKQPKARRASGGDSLAEMREVLESRKKYVESNGGVSTDGVPSPTSVRSIEEEDATPAEVRRRNRHRGSSNSLHKIAAESSTGRRRLSGTSLQLQRAVLDAGDTVPKSRSATSLSQMVADSTIVSAKARRTSRSDRLARKVERAKSDSHTRKKISRSTTLSGASDHTPSSGSAGRLGMLTRSEGGGVRGLRRSMSGGEVGLQATQKERRKPDAPLTRQAPCPGSGTSLSSFRRGHKSDTLLQRAIVEGTTPDEKRGNHDASWTSKKGSGGLSGQVVAKQLKKADALKEKQLVLTRSSFQESHSSPDFEDDFSFSEDDFEEKVEAPIPAKLGGSLNAGDGSAINIQDLIAMRDTLETAIACMSGGGKHECSKEEESESEEGTDEDSVDGPDYDWANGIHAID